MTYAEKLKDPRWQKKRLEILERDQWHCKICFEDKTSLHVHHKTYEYNILPWDYDNENFITLCDKCHQKEEMQKIYFNHSIKYLLKKGLYYNDLLELISEKFLLIYEADEQKGQSNG